MLPRKLFLAAAGLASDVLSGGREVMPDEKSIEVPSSRVWRCSHCCLRPQLCHCSAPAVPWRKGLRLRNIGALIIT